VNAKAPAANPCGSCPYRRDVPSGVWETAEYEKLPGYDGETFEQPIGVFHCHRQDGRICAGWAGCHDMENSLAVRISASSGRLSAEVVEALFDYETSTPLFDSGAEAAEHGMQEVEAPGPGAQRIIDKLKQGAV
jgi:hypothetical protein